MPAGAPVLTTFVIVAVSLAAVLAAVMVYGAFRWAAGTRELRARLDAARTPMKPQVVDFQELEGLPAPVQRYFRTVLKEGQPMVTGVRVQHRGTFNLGETITSRISQPSTRLPGHSAPCSCWDPCGSDGSGWSRAASGFSFGAMLAGWPAACSSCMR